MTDETKPPEPAPEAEGAPDAAAVAALPPPAIDLSDYDIKPDMFEGIHVLEDNFEKIEGAPNFRQLKGFPIFGTGQPTEAAMVEIINKAKEGAGREGVKVIIISISIFLFLFFVKVFWFTMRQEPIVYVNGAPYAPRHPEKP